MVAILLIILLTLFGTSVIAPNTEVTPEVTDCLVQASETDSTTDSCRPTTPAVVPSPVASDCIVQPRTLGGVNEIALTAGTPVPGTLPLDESIPYVKPEGAPAPAVAVEGVTWTIEQFAACANAGDYLHFLALFSDDFIRGNAELIGVPLEEGDSVLTPEPSPEDGRVSIVEIADVIELSDGSISALATFEVPDDFAPTLIQFTLSFDQDRDRWLIDEFRQIATESGPAGWMLVQGEGYEGVIVPVDGAQEIVTLYIFEPVDDYWTPTEDDIAALERDMPSYLQTMAAVTRGVRPGFVDRLPEYERQYAGFVQDGRKLILVNATCAGEDLNWRTQPVFVMDGGDCFFRVTYDPATGSFEDFDVNGEA